MDRHKLSLDFSPLGDEQDCEEANPTTDSETDEDMLEEEQTRFLSDEESLGTTSNSSPAKSATVFVHLKRNFSEETFHGVRWESSPCKRSKFTVTLENEHFRLPRYSSSTARTAWLQLPEELFAKIFMTLNDSEVARITEVCTMWRRLAQTDDMYQHRCLLRWGTTVSLTSVQDGHTTAWQQLYTKRCTLLSKYVVCSTFFKQADKAEFKRKVSSLGGTYSDHFTSNVTHLIASRVGSSKYQLAMRLGLPVVTHDWLDQCYEASTVPTDLAFRLLPLSGCCITVTGLSQADRSIVEQTARMFGAEFSPDLRRNRTTHLIAASARGAKYDAAVRWGDILIVRPKWFFDSIVRSMCMQEQLYTVTSSTVDQSDTDISAIS
jgi:hypothetical protein